MRKWPDRRGQVLTVLIFLAGWTGESEAQVSVDSLVATLDSPAWEERAVALFALQTLPDSALPTAYSEKVLKLLDQEAVTPLAVLDTIGEGYGSYRIALVRESLQLGDPAAIRGLAYLGVQVNDDSAVFLAEQGSASIDALDEAWSNAPDARTGIMVAWGYLVGPYRAGITSGERTYLLSRLLREADDEQIGFMSAAHDALLAAAVPIFEEIAESGRFSFTAGRLLPELETLRSQMTPEELHGELQELQRAMCLEAAGEKADVCAALSGYLQAGAADTQALGDLIAAADSAFATGALTSFERALLVGNARLLIEAAGGVASAPSGLPAN